MLPAAEINMMDPRTADAHSHPFIAVVTVTAVGQTVIFPFVKKAASASAIVIDFGDGESYESTGDIEATVTGSGESLDLDNVFTYAYQTVGTYVLTIDGAEQLGFSYGDGSYIVWPSGGTVSRFDVVRCRLLVRGKAPSWTVDNRGTQLSGMGWMTSFTADTMTGLEWYACSPPKVLRLPNVTVNTQTWSGVLLFMGAIEAIYAPKWQNNSQIRNMFSNAQKLMLAYLPSFTRLTRRNMFSKFSVGAEVYFGHLTSLSSTAFYDTYNANYGGGDVQEVYESGGCTLNLHVQMTEAEFKALSGWTAPTTPGTATHPWGAEYLKIFTTDRTFDTKGYYYREDGKKTDVNGVLLDSQGKWVDEDGNYVMPDGVTPCIWKNGIYYRSDRQGRRMSDDGLYYLNWDGHIVSDCGRTCTSDGEFIQVVNTEAYDYDDDAVHGNIEDFYYAVKSTKTQLTDEWYEQHPDADPSWGYWCYPMTETVIGYTVSSKRFYDKYGYLKGTYLDSPPDGRLSSAFVPEYSYMRLGITTDGITSIRIVGTEPRSSWIDETWIDASPSATFDYGFINNESVGTSAFSLMPTIVYNEQQQTYSCGASAYINGVRATVYLKDGHSYIDDIDTFDLTFGNMFVTDNEKQETVTKETQTAPTGGWGQLILGGQSGGGTFYIKTLQMFSGSILVHNLVPWVLNGHVVMKDLVTGVVHQVTSGTWRIGAYYTGGNNV